MPLVTALLFVIGAIGLYVEISAPGIGLGGLVAGLSLTLFFWSRFLGGTAGWLEVILVVAGAMFLAVEIFVLPGFGIAGIIGLLLMGAGIVLASQNHVIPQSARGMHELGMSLVVLVASGVLSLVAAAVLSHTSVPFPFSIACPACASAAVRRCGRTGRKTFASRAAFSGRSGGPGSGRIAAAPGGQGQLRRRVCRRRHRWQLRRTRPPGADHRDQRQPRRRARSRRVARLNLARRRNRQTPHRGGSVCSHCD